MAKDLQTRILLLLLAATMTVTTAAPARAANTETGEAKIRLLEDKFKTLDPKNEDAKSALLKSAADAVAGLSKNPKAKLDTIQIREVVELLRVSDRHDFYHLIVEQNVELFEANEKAIRRELKKLPPKEAKEIGETLSIVLSGDEGTDLPGPTEPKTKPKSH